MAKLMKIAPIEWESFQDGKWLSFHSVFGSYSIDVEQEDSGTSVRWRYCFDEYYDEGESTAESVEDAKQQVEEHYLERLMPALIEVETSS